MMRASSGSPGNETPVLRKRTRSGCLPCRERRRKCDELDHNVGIAYCAVALANGASRSPSIPPGHSVYLAMTLLPWRRLSGGERAALVRHWPRRKSLMRQTIFFVAIPLVTMMRRFPRPVPVPSAGIARCRWTKGSRFPAVSFRPRHLILSMASGERGKTN
ncbi:uncharacterized protein BDV17DRAFT_145237 [Aspergillus undulatus]|uniref:uncharacterized protein n=1 Tax=Aspergillus undulatus TaxID=1810928 RepID=UPI003CCC99E4